MARRTALVALLAAGAPAIAQDRSAPRSLDDWRRLLAAPAAPPGRIDSAERRQRLDEGEAALIAGDAAAAHDAFQRAALMAHAADTECSIVRAMMQAGHYRNALAFGAHTALAHRDYPGGAALYAWLLHVGGQSAFAAQRLDEARRLAPDDAALRLAREQLSGPWPRASGALLARPMRIAPYGHGAMPVRAQAVGTAVLCGDGRSALAALSVIGGAREVWLRNGMGATAAARVEERNASLGVARLALNAALPIAAELQAAARDPFAGSPATMVEYAPAADDGAAWPLLRQGFVGRTTAAGDRLLGLAAPAGPRGGPVFDAAGRWAGLAMSADTGPDRFMPASMLQTLGSATSAVATAAAAPAPLDAVYETALRITLQVLRDPAAA
jgi:hypothetical protein